MVNGICHWMQAILAFKALRKVSPVTYSVANSVKRIFVIVSSVLWFGNVVTFTNAIGIILAITGVLLYNKAKIDMQEAKFKSKTKPVLVRV